MQGAPRLLAEWARQDAVLMSWPTRNMDWKEYLPEIHATYEKIILALLRFVDVVLITPRDSELKAEFLEEARKAQFKLYRLEGIDLNDTWIRDYGPLCLSDGTGGKEVADFSFNGWGGKFEARRDNDFTRKFYEAGYFREGIRYRDCRDFVFEGGAIDVSDKGEGLTTLPIFTYPGRNAGTVEAQKDRVMSELGLSSLPVLPATPLEGDDTDGHVDTLTRYMPGGEMLSCMEIEETTRDLRKDIRISFLPTPDAVIWDGEKKPATYANFLFTNGAILVPTYGDPARDQEALEMVHRFGGQREVVGIDCRTLVRQNGSLHCATMQIPENFLDKTKLTEA